MFKNYLTTAFRNFGRHKLFSFINISGLSIGISAALIIFTIVAYEFSFEKFEKDRNHIYRVVSTMHFPDQEFSNSGIPVPLAGAAKRNLTGIDIATHFFLYPGRVTVSSRVLAIIIAAPAAGWVMYHWLEDFAYRTSTSWWVFLVSGELMIVIALLTLSIQTIRSATANPVKSLRTE